MRGRTISLIRGIFKLLDSSTQGLILPSTTFSSKAATLGGRVAGAAVITCGGGGGGGGTGEAVAAGSGEAELAGGLLDG